MIAITWPGGRTINSDSHDIPTYPLIAVTWSNSTVRGFAIRTCTGMSRSPTTGTVELFRTWYNDSGKTDGLAKECEAYVRAKLRKLMDDY